MTSVSFSHDDLTALIGKAIDDGKIGLDRAADWLAILAPRSGLADPVSKALIGGFVRQAMPTQKVSESDTKRVTKTAAPISKTITKTTIPITERGTMNTEIAKIARLDDFDLPAAIEKAATTGAISKADLSELLDRKAAAQRRPGESNAQVFTRYITTDPTGSALYQQMKSMRGFDHHQARAFAGMSPKARDLVMKARAKPLDERGADDEPDADADEKKWAAMMAEAKRGGPAGYRSDSEAINYLLTQPAARAIFDRRKARGLAANG